MIKLKNHWNNAKSFLAIKYLNLIAEIKRLQRFKFRQVVSKKAMPAIAFMLASMMILVPLTALATDNDLSSAEETYSGEDETIFEESAEEYTLTVSSTDGGEVTYPGEGEFNYVEGEEVTVTAEADEGYKFVNWTEAGEEESYTFYMPDSNLSIEAAFEPDEEVGVERAEATQDGEPGPTGKGITPVDLYPPSTSPLGPDPTVDDVEARCDDVSAIKVDIGHDENFEIGVPRTFSRGDDDTASAGPDVPFSVTIVRNADDTFDFYGATQPVNNVWVKGGRGGYLFQYYPTFDPGVYSDNGLYSPQPGWSHITFYYCGEPTTDPEPELTITKEADTDVSKVGDPINYTVIVTNTGDVDLEVEVNDSLEGLLFDNMIAAGESETFEYEYIVPEGDSDPLVNTVTATWSYDGETGSVQDSVNIPLVNPAIELTKSVNPVNAVVGGNVIYTIKIENTGDHPLKNITATDELLGGDITADFGFDEPLEPDDWEEATFDYTIGADDVIDGKVVNTASVSSNPVGLLNNIADTDSAEVTVSDLQPGSLQITKTWEELPDYFDQSNLPESIIVTISGDKDGLTYPTEGQDVTIERSENETGGYVWEWENDEMIPGDYTVEKDALEGWVLTMDPGDGEVTVVSGESVSVDITNTFVNCCMKLSKVFLAPEGVDVPVTEIDVQVTGLEDLLYGTEYSERHTIKEEDGWVKLICDLVPGTYEIEEITSIDGWLVTYDPEDRLVEVIDIEDQPGLDATLTITNELELGFLKVLKSWAGPFEGDDLPADVTAFVYAEEDDNYIDTITLTEDGNWEGYLGSLIPGTYYVIESEVPGFTTTYPDGNEATVSAGEAVYAEEVEILNTFPDDNGTVDDDDDNGTVDDDDNGTGNGEDDNGTGNGEDDNGVVEDDDDDDFTTPVPFTDDDPDEIVTFEDPEDTDVDPDDPDTVEVDPEDPEVDPDDPEDPDADPDEPEELTVDPEDPEVDPDDPEDPETDPDDPETLTVDPEEPETTPEAGGTSIPMISLGILLTSSGIIMRRYFN